MVSSLPSVFSPYHSSHAFFSPTAICGSKSDRYKRQGSLGPEQLQIYRPEKFLKRTPENHIGGRRGTWEGVPSHIQGVLEGNTLSDGWWWV